MVKRFDEEMIDIYKIYEGSAILFRLEASCQATAIRRYTQIMELGSPIELMFKVGDALSFLCYDSFRLGA